MTWLPHIYKRTAAACEFSSDLEMLYLFLITRALNCNNVSNQAISLFGDEYRLGLIKVTLCSVSPGGGAGSPAVKERRVAAGGCLGPRGKGGRPRGVNRQDLPGMCAPRSLGEIPCINPPLLIPSLFPSLDSIAFSSQSFHRRTNNSNQLP